MTKKLITDLPADIYKVLDSTQEHSPDSKLAASYAMSIGGALAKATTKRTKKREVGTLWASDLGKKCHRQVWYSFHEADEATPHTGNTKFKFLYGNILEDAVLYLAEEAGHEVKHQQYSVELALHDDWKIRGRIDAVIDGVMMDAKSCSSFAFKKFKYGITPDNDNFGYLYQLGYYHNYYPEPTLGIPGFLLVEKQMGHIQWSPAKVPSAAEVTNRAVQLTNAVDQLVEHKVNKLEDIPDGKSGNRKLSTNCSYCDFKHHCWRDSNSGKGLRTFAYSNGPSFLTEVAREPQVPEVHR